MRQMRLDKSGNGVLGVGRLATRLGNARFYMESNSGDEGLSHAFLLFVTVV